MRYVVVLCAVLFGCKTDDTRYGINIPTGSGVVSGGIDAPSAHDDGGGGDGGPTLAGRACLIVLDARSLVTCATGGAGGFTVKLGTKTATTADDGSFTIDRPSGTNLVWLVTGDTIVPGAMSYSASTVIPVIDANTYLELEGDNGIIPVQDEGAIMARVIHGSSGVPGATATASPLGIYTSFYDGNDATQWNQNMTGAFGAVWVPGLATGSAMLTVTPPGGGTNVPVTGIPIIDGGVTIVVVEI